MSSQMVKDVQLPPVSGAAEQLQAQKYVSLTTFRRDGTPVRTPVWFGREADKLFVMTRSDSGKYKRIRNNPQVRIAACTVRGTIAGPEFSGTARILPVGEHAHARQIIKKKYWAARIPFIWRRTDAYLEISLEQE
jgi:PPOX class probable F420-dependent enzyme